MNGKSEIQRLKVKVVSKSVQKAHQEPSRRQHPHKHSNWWHTPHLITIHIIIIIMTSIQIIMIMSDIYSIIIGFLYYFYSSVLEKGAKNNLDT